MKKFNFLEQDNNITISTTNSDVGKQSTFCLLMKSYGVNISNEWKKSFNRFGYILMLDNLRAICSTAAFNIFNSQIPFF